MDRMRRTRYVWLAAIGAVLATVVVLGTGRHASHEAAAATGTSADTVTVTGVGTADGAPDTLSAEFTVQVTRSSVQAALDAQSAAARRLFSSLQRAGVKRTDMQTADLQLNRHYDNHGTVTGYDASQTVRAKVSPLSHAGRTISAGARSSGNDVTVGQLTFDVVNDKSLLTQARANAYSDARDRAEQYASLAGRSLGPVQKISETVQPPAPVPYYAADAFRSAATAGKAAAVPLQGGQQTLTVNVTVVWALS
jgi:uncharacterized protein YggE